MSGKRSVRVKLKNTAIAMACLLACSLANAADSLDSLPPDVQVDVLMKRITNSILTSDYKSALPSFRKLNSFNKPMPESFDFFYIEALSKSNTEETDIEADERIKLYFSRWGKQGAHYKKVIEYSADVMPRAETARVAAQRKAEAEMAARQKREDIERSWRPHRFESWVMDTEGSNSCSRTLSRISVSNSAIRRFDCSCSTEAMEHPAWRDHTKQVCSGTLEINLKIDPDGYLNARGVTNKWGVEIK